MDKERLGQKEKSIRVVVNSKQRLANKNRKGAVMNAYDHLNEGFKLSLKKDKFDVFEHIDENPLYINNFGMASRLYRYIFSDTYFPLSYF